MGMGNNNFNQAPQQPAKVTPVEEILNMYPHLKHVNKNFTGSIPDNAEFIVMKSYNEQNIF